MGIKKKWRLVVFLWAIFAVFSFSGCSPKADETERPYQVVSAIHIQYRNDSVTGELLLTEDVEVQTILEYLRSISPYGTPTEDPNQVIGSHYYITLLHSDGSRNTYHQLADRMMQLDNGPWKRIDEERGKKLGQLLADIPIKDFIPGTTPAPPLLRPELRG